MMETWARGARFTITQRDDEWRGLPIPTLSREKAAQAGRQKGKYVHAAEEVCRHNRREGHRGSGDRGVPF